MLAAKISFARKFDRQEETREGSTPGCRLSNSSGDHCVTLKKFSMVIIFSDSITAFLITTFPNNYSDTARRGALSTFSLYSMWPVLKKLWNVDFLDSYDVCCVSGPDVQLAKLVVRNVLPCLSNWSLPPSLPSLLPLNKEYFFFTVPAKINLFTRSLLPEGSRLQVGNLSVCLFVSHHFKLQDFEYRPFLYHARITSDPTNHILLGRG